MNTDKNHDKKGPPEFALKMMRAVNNLISSNDSNENMRAAQMFNLMAGVRNFLTLKPIVHGLKKLGGKEVWPVIPGIYKVGDSNSPVAVCTLTSKDLFVRFSEYPGVVV